MDRRVMEKLGLKPGDRLKSSEIFALVRDKIKPGDLADICRGCEWQSLGFCQRGLEHLTQEDANARRRRQDAT
jgi:hypothetical protein